eukprot:744407-Pleurochrysis_carterae.AAC.1
MHVKKRTVRMLGIILGIVVDQPRPAKGAKGICKVRSKATRNSTALQERALAPAQAIDALMSTQVKDLVEHGGTELRRKQQVQAGRYTIVEACCGPGFH